jgi:hypothetical protein
MRALLMALVLSGCTVSPELAGVARTSSGASVAEPISTASGRPGYYIDCGGYAQTMVACIQRANALCPGGYDVAGAHEQEGATQAMVVGGVHTTWTPVARSMVVECRQ